MINYLKLNLVKNKSQREVQPKIDLRLKGALLEEHNEKRRILELLLHNLVRMFKEILMVKTIYVVK